MEKYYENILKLDKESLYDKVANVLKSSSKVYTLEEILLKFEITTPGEEQLFNINLAFNWAAHSLFQYMEDGPIKTKLMLNAKLKNILYLVDSLIHEDNERNYGDRDISIHKLKNSWEEFIELHPESLDPCLLSQRNLIRL